MKYEEWLKEWLDNYVKPTSKKRTCDRYGEIANNHIIPHLGECDLNELTPIVIQKFVSRLSRCGNLKNGAGLSPNSVNSIITVMQGSLEVANRIGLLDAHVVDKIKRPKRSEKKVECLSFAEQKKLERYIVSSEKNNLFGIFFCLYTGLRIGELLALEWSDIDVVKNEITISKTCYYGKNCDGVFERIIDVPKTQTSVRKIPLPRKLMPYLREARRKSGSKYVVSNEKKPMTIRSYQRVFDVLQKKLNLPHRGFHSLRHTFATRALECGMDVKTLAEILGHKNPTITLNRYTHSLMKHKKDMMNKLGKLL